MALFSEIKNSGTLGLIFLSFCLVISCGPSELSKKGVSDLSPICAVITVNQHIQHDHENYMQVRLSDQKGRDIRNDSISLFVNGSKMELIVTKGLYYTSDSKYFFENAAVKNGLYSFDIQLSSGKKYHLGEVKALRVADSGEVLVDEKPDRNKDITIKWAGLQDVNYLIISGSSKLRQSAGSTITSYVADPGDSIKIADSGSHLIPKSSLATAGKTVESLKFNFIARKNGVVHEDLLKGSSICISGEIEKSINFK